MQRFTRKGKLSLTSRLALFFTSVAAAVVLGLGGLFLVVTEKHFVELDRMTLQDKRHLIEKILQNTKSVDDARWRLNEALNYHEDLQVQVKDAQGETVFQSPASGFAVPDRNSTFIDKEGSFEVWRHADAEFHTLSFDLLASIIDRHPAGICHGSGCEGIVAEAGAQK